MSTISSIMYVEEASYSVEVRLGNPSEDNVSIFGVSIKFKLILLF